jgi:nitroimidazol reductase NimA-like FMN-containing flavoprotein (pyridoxamine 5'-phosphate oxidase superfamily)
MPLAPKRFVESRKEMEDILRGRTLGFLGLAAGGEPYVVPLTCVYAGGRILFHCAFTGKKPDFLRADPRVCFAVGDQSGEPVRHPGVGPWRADHDSVICCGKAPDAEAITPEAVAKCLAVEIGSRR